MPKVSVIMGVYNDAHRVGAAIASILEQTYTDWELIVCDDGSQDGTLPVLESWAANDARIRVLRNEPNMGIHYTRNRCAAEATGQYIAHQDSDDVSHPERLARQVAFLDEHPEFALVSSAVRLVDEGGQWGVRSALHLPRKENFLWSSCFSNPAMIIRKSVLDEVGCFRISWETRRAEDYDLFMRVYAAGYRGCNFMEPLLDYYESRSSMAKRKYRYRLGEAAVRLRGFCALGLMPRGIPFVIKPLIVGLIPRRLLHAYKRRREAVPPCPALPRARS